MVSYLGPVPDRVRRLELLLDLPLGPHVSEPTGFGFAQRALDQPRQLGAAQQRRPAGATAPVDGGGSDSLTTGGNEYLHSQAYGAAVDNTASPTARPASAATSRSSTTSTRRAATSPPTRTPPATRARRSPAAARSEGRDVQPQPADRTPASDRTREQLTMKRKGRRGKGMSKFAAGADRDHRDRRVLVRRVHQVRQPVREPVHDPRRLLERERASAGLAGPDRRRRRRQGRRASRPCRVPVGITEPESRARRPT